jgi:dihydrofolate reductase
MIITISPKIFGYGISLFTEEISMELELKKVKQFAKNLVYLRYSVVK